MKIRVLFLLLVLFSSKAFGQLSENMYENAQNRSAVYQKAKSDLGKAEKNFNTLKEDSFTTPVELSRANENVILARAALVSAGLVLRSDLVGKFFAWKNSSALVTIAQQKLDLSNLKLAALRLRFQNGVVTALAVSKAESSAKVQQLELKKSQDQLVTVKTALVKMLGKLPAENETNLATPKLEPPKGLYIPKDIRQTNTWKIKRQHLRVSKQPYNH